VNWDDAVLYCNAKSKEDGLDTVYEFSEISGAGVLSMLSGLKSDLSKNGYRLPTEAEWEYACRGGTATDYYWGKNYKNYPSTSADSAEVSKSAIWRVNSYDIGMGVSGYGVHEVTSTQANRYGLYGMAGNVSEHIHDFEVLEYDYKNVTDPSGPEQGDIHFLRGGNWGNDALQLRSSSRNFVAANYSFFFCGFRTVKKAQ
jgi:formylglycine-generating enzyme required for sulfatase activity